MSGPTSLLDLPDELIHNIFIHLPASSAALLGQTSKRLHKISSTPSLWREHCREVWSFWEERDDRPIPDYDTHSGTQWKQVFFDKVTKDKKILATFDDLLGSQQYRIARIQEIVETYKYDAKDVLERLVNTPDDAEDVLARRYWSDVVLRLVHRQKALEIWNHMQYQDYSSLEDAIGAFDVFVQRPGRHAEISRLKQEINAIAQNIKSSHPEWNDMHYTTKAVAITKYLKQHQLIGCSDEDYNLLRNRFICHAFLCDGEKTMLPLQSVVIFSCVAQKLGVNAWPCDFPGTVLAVVEPPEGPHLKDTRSSQTFRPELRWMDPFNHDEFIPEQTLRERLSRFRDSQGRRPYADPSVQFSALTRTFTRSMVTRTAMNILISLSHHGAPSEIDHTAAILSALWSTVMMSEVDASSSPEAFLRYQHHLLRVHNYLDSLFGQGQLFEDVMFLERYALPAMAGVEARNKLAQTIEGIRIADANANPITRRDEHNHEVRYKIGQLFRHARYGYIGTIIGWDPRCQAGETWIQTMRVKDLPRGCEQSFYHILGADESLRYVAEENMVILEEDPPEVLMKLAGRYFKRWDDKNKVFVSNIRDEYPDD